MTAPAPAQPQTSTQQPDPATAEIAALLASLITAGLGVAATAVALAALRARPEWLRIASLLGVEPDVANAVLTLSFRRSPLPNTNVPAPGTAAVRRQTQTTNLLRRAAYLVNAARRVSEAARTPLVPVGQPDGSFVPTPVQDPLSERAKRLREALQAERRYWQAHVRAQQERNAAARAIDDAARAHGDLLGWVARTNPDGTFIDGVTKRCRANHMRNFRVSQPPSEGFPGLATEHTGCLCSPGPPWATRKMVR